MSDEIIVIISEGERTEKQIIENIESHFFSHEGLKSLTFLSFKTNIYALWRALKKDNFDTDIIEVMRERDEEAARILTGINRRSISEVYLFFDYDGHAHPIQHEVETIINEMIDNFNNETENGKIYISYPMVEAIKHLRKNDNTFKDRCILAKQNIHYKHLVSQNTDFTNLTILSLSDWNYIMINNIMKANYMLNGDYQVPDYDLYRMQIYQSSLLQCQIEKYIKLTKQVAVLSGFPFFLIDYFGKSIYDNCTTAVPICSDLPVIISNKNIIE
ncbi:MAG TPA: hypothetical protein IAA29_05180 [Candidatus Paenibacillus intestinavium]|nr:hypothetical protein [Candidatus Paenibacillus intestinavium]